MLTFLRDIGKFARVNVMLSRESVKQRLSRDEGISFTEYVRTAGCTLSGARFCRPEALSVRKQLIKLMQS